MQKRYIGVIFASLVALLLLAGAAFTWNAVTKTLKPTRPAAAADEEETDLPEEPEDNADFVPTEDDVLAARERALEGLTPEQAQRLTELISSANLWWERQYLRNNIFDRLENPEDPEHSDWNYFDHTGEFQVGWAWDGELDKDEVCREEGLTAAEFYAKYGMRVMASNNCDADGFTAMLGELQEAVQNEALRTDLQYIIDEAQIAKRTHVMEHANNMYKALHDMDYFLLRYGPRIDAEIQDKSTVSKYYGMLSIYDD